MITHLQLSDVGPSRELTFEPAPRLNLLTGDNGLGKTFVLDVLWWLLADSWTGEIAFPWRPPRDPADERGRGSNNGEPNIRPRMDIRCARPGEERGLASHGTWEPSSQSWSTPGWPNSDLNPPDSASPRGRVPGLVIYVRIDGTFAVWDSLHPHGRTDDQGNTALVFDTEEIWTGKRVADRKGRPRTLCRGLLEDWVTWQGTNATEFETLQEVLRQLSAPGEELKPGPPTRVRLDDRVDVPTLALPYGEVPVTLASAGTKRVLALAYLLVWAWSEHKKASQLIGRPPTLDMVVLIDEVELHLHPKWQRSLLPSLLAALDTIAAEVRPQLFVTTHAPLVLTSVETLFHEDRDDLHLLQRDGTVVRARELPFGKEGDVRGWLWSDVFGRVSDRGREAALAVQAASHLMAEREQQAEASLDELWRLLRAMSPQRPHALDDLELFDQIADELDRSRPIAERIQDALRRTLPGHDVFWTQWSLLYRPTGTRGADAPR